jgi:type IV pilus assembly protein PilA
MILKNKNKAVNLKKRRGGFTLIELIVVIAVIAILASVMLPRFTGFTDSARKSAMTSDMRNYATGVSALIAQGDTVTPDAVKAMVGDLGGTFATANVKSEGDDTTATLATDSSADKTAYNPSGGDFKYTKEISGKSCVGTFDYEKNRVIIDIP